MTPYAASSQPSPDAPHNPLTELYRDKWLLAVHKPAGLLVHRSHSDKHETEFARQYARALSGGARVDPVDRLDRPTAGLQVFARHAEPAGRPAHAVSADGG